MYADRINAKMGEGQFGKQPFTSVDIFESSRRFLASCFARRRQDVLIIDCRIYVNTSGTFGQVLECWDREREEMVAIKIIRGIKKYKDAAMIEIGMLEQICKYEKSRSR